MLLVGDGQGGAGDGDGEGNPDLVLADYLAVLDANSAVW